MNRVIHKYWTVFRVSMLVLWVRVLLRFLKLPNVLSVLEPKPALVKSDGAAIEQLIYYIDRWLVLFPYNTKGNCFPRSVALYWCARRSGFPVHLHCGVRKDGGKLDGHAWLMLDGHPFHEVSRQWEQFTVTFSYPSDPVPDRAQKRLAR